MSKELKRVKPLGKRELDLIVGGVGAFTNNFYAQFVANGNIFTGADRQKYAGGIDGQADGHSYLMVAVYPSGGEQLQAGWNFKFGFPDQSWANAYAGGAADFKAGFIGLYGSNKWKGWGSSQSVEFG